VNVVVSAGSVAARANNPRLSLVCYRDQNGQDWADIIDFLTPEARRKVVRLLGEIKATEQR
jgi:hypothetical protein